MAAEDSACCHVVSALANCVRSYFVIKMSSIVIFSIVFV